MKPLSNVGFPALPLYRWIERYQTGGKESLQGYSKRPNKLAKQKINDSLCELITSLRKEFKIGPQRIPTYLLRIYILDISASIIWQVLKKQEVPDLKKYRKHNEYTCYNRPIPRDRVQMDVTTVGPKCYPFTAIDDCTQLRALKLYPNKKQNQLSTF